MKFNLLLPVIFSVLCLILFVGCQTEPKVAVSELCLPCEKAEGNQCVRDWLFLGPFRFKAEDFKGEHQQEVADHAFMPNECALDGTQKAPKGTKWEPQSFEDSQINLDDVYGDIEYAVMYGVCWLQCKQDIPDATLMVGSDDYLTVWVNGKKVHTYKEQRRAGDLDQDEVKGIALKKGYNRIVVKCTDIVYDWNYYFRFTTKDGKDIKVKPIKVPEKK